MDTVFFPWVRKGLANSISEEEVFGKVEGNDALARMRAALSIRAQYRAYADDKDKEGTQFTQEKEIALYGPADVSGINSDAVSLCHPDLGSEGLPVSYFPYIEFWEPDFPWRYTPARPSADGRLRPWIALLTFRADQVNIQKPDNHLPFLRFNGTPEEYAAVFYDIRELSRAAHAQGPDSKAPTLSRIISLRGWKPGLEHHDMVDLEEETEYIAALVPTFEIGRLRGLGIGPEALQDIPAQTAAWDAYEVQQARTRGLEFPIYYSWTFKTGTLAFEDLVRTLTLGQPTKPGVPIDVAHMGNGFDYSVVKPGKGARQTITLPAATRAPQHTVEADFPAKTGAEAKVYKNLEELVGNNPVFLENAEDIGAQIDGTQLKALQDDDPWVVPPAYGARHAMATSLDKYEWLKKLNLDVHYRVAAGLGRKAVQQNQEELMDRAWKQIEAVQAFNQQLYQRLLSIGTNTSLQGKVVGQYGTDNKYLASLMFYLGSLKDANSRNGKGTDSSITAALAGMDVASAFATPAFHRMTDQVAKIVEELDTKTLMENMLEHHTCAFPDPYCEDSYSLAALRKYSDDAFVSIFTYLWNNFVGHYFKDPATGKPGVPVTTTSLACHDELRCIGRNYVEGMPLEHGYRVGPEPDFSLSDLRVCVDKLGHLPDYNHPLRNIIPGTTYGWYGGFTRYALEFGLVKPGPRQNHECRKMFFDKRLDRHPVAGSVQETKSSGQVRNLVCLREEDYRQFFGQSKPITEFIESGVHFYFANLDYLIDLRTLEVVYNKTAPKDKQKNSLSLFLSFPVAGISVKEHFVNGSAPVEIPLGRQNVRVWYHGSYAGYGSRYWDGPPYEYSSMEEKERLDAEDQYYLEKAEEYLMNTPCSVSLNKASFANDIQVFASPEEYRDFLLAKDDRDLLPYMSLWKEFNGMLEQLEAKFPPKAPAPAPPKVEPPTMRDDVPYEEALEAVRDYYSELYADTLTGAKLREEYVDDLLRSKYPILAYPIFPEPTYYYLKEFSEEMIVPGAAKLPEDSVTLFESDSAFVEAYLAGLNTEMGRELLWREYPTDQRGSYFRKFWDSESNVASIRKDTFFDITSMHTWTKPLGGNMQKGKENLLIFAIKGRLMRLYPKTRVYLHKAILAKNRQLAYDPAATEGNKGILPPVMETFINGDTLLLGFNISFAAALGNPAQKNYGYILTFKEDVEGLDFLVEEAGADFREDLDSAEFANILKNDPSIMGKHLSLFLKH